MTGAAALLGGLLALGTAPELAQAPPVTIEHRPTTAARGEDPAVVDSAAGVGVTLVFRVVNAATITHNVFTRVAVPAGWQVLFVGDRLDLPAQGAVIETVTIAVPKGAAAGDYIVRYEARLTPTDAPITSAVTIRIGERRQLELSWIGVPAYLASGEPGTFALLLTNHGNVSETVTLSVSSSLAVPLHASWSKGTIDAGGQRRVTVVREPGDVGHVSRETLTARAAAEGMPAATEAGAGFDVVPEGRAPNASRSTLPTSLVFRAGTGRSVGFGSFVGSGAFGARRATRITFGVVPRDRSHPLMFERDRNYLTVSAPGLRLAAGDQTWALSYLTEGGHYGLGAGGRIERRHWAAAAFADTGRHDAAEGSQAGASLGVSTGRIITVSAQYLARFAGNLGSDRIADIGSLRLILKPIAAVTADFEAGIGQSMAGTGRAFSGLLSFTSTRVSLYGRRVRKDDVYPLRDRTGLIDGAGVTLRPFGQLQLQGTLDGTTQIDDPTLPLNAPTRQRMTRARAAWGSLASVTVGRTDWTSPGQDWSAQWRRESVTAEVRIPLGALWIAPGVERGTEATPSYAETPYSLSWLQAGVRLGGKNSADVRFEYGRGDAGVADRIVRRISFGATLQPIEATRVTLRVSNGARDALWMQGSQSINALIDQRLPWRHHLVVHYRRRAGAGIFVRNDEAYRVDYVIPIGIPVRSAGDLARITVRLHDGLSGKALERMLVQIKGQTRLTDDDGVVTFTGLKPGDYHVTVAPESLGPGHAVMPALPLRVSVKAGDRTEVRAAVVRTGRLTGVMQKFDRTPELTAGNGVANALIELVIGGEYRMAITDADGRFSFDGVPPGTWRLRVVRAAIPAFYRLEESQVTVDLTSAGTSHIVLRILPKSQDPPASTFERRQSP